MGDGALTQQEIDALLSGEADFSEFGKSEPHDLEEEVILERPKAEKKTAAKTSKGKSLLDFDQGIANNIALLLDVPMTLTVELGRTKRSIQDVLRFTNGYIIELDKLIGEPVEVLVNDRIIAKGEVVIEDDDYCVRITEILDPQERLKYLQ